jgi:hypothetical protein
VDVLDGNLEAIEATGFCCLDLLGEVLNLKRKIKI